MMLAVGEPLRTNSVRPELPPAAEIAEIIGSPLDGWPGNCHGISLAIVRAGLIPHARVARGWCAGVMSQHSWIVCPQLDASEVPMLGDCYAENAMIVDPTLWTYRSDVEDVYVAPADAKGWHTPHGLGPHIMEQGRPDLPVGTPIALDPDAYEAMGSDAKWWVRNMLGPLDKHGWGQLAHMTVIGWESADIIRAMQLTPGLRDITPIDRVGMLTTLNPGGLYLHADDAEPAPEEG